jgi:hypothetical protein
MQSEKDVLQSRRCRSKRQRNEAVYTCNFALPDAFVGETLGKVATEIAVVNGFFVSVCFHDDSDTMRYVGGGVLNNPVTRASQSRERGRIPRARWLKQSGIVRCDDMAPRVKRQAQSELSVVTRLGCALLKHSPRVNHGNNKRVDRPNQRRARTDQRATAVAFDLMQRTPLRWETNTRPSCKLSAALPKLSWHSAARQGFQRLGITGNLE